MRFLIGCVLVLFLLAPGAFAQTTDSQPWNKPAETETETDVETEPQTGAHTEEAQADLKALVEVIIGLGNYDLAFKLLDPLELTEDEDTYDSALYALGLVERQGLSHAALELLTGDDVYDELVALDDEEILRFVHLLRTYAAYSAGDPDQLSASLELLQEMVPEIEGPEGELARFVAETVAFAAEFDRRPNVSVNDFLERAEQAWEHLEEVAGETGEVPSIERHLAADSVRLWSQINLELLNRLPDGHPERTRLAAHLEQTLEGTAEIAALGEDFENHHPETWNFEFITLVADLYLDVAEDHLRWDRLELSRQWLKQAKEALDTVLIGADTADDLLLEQHAELFQKLEVTDVIEGTSAARLLARSNAMEAKLAFAEGDHDKVPGLILEAVEFYDQTTAYREMADFMLEASSFFLDEEEPWSERTSVTYINAALEMSQGIHYRAGTIKALAARGASAFQDGQLEMAETDLQAAVDDLEDFISESGASEAGATRLRARATTAYDLLTRIHLQQGQPEKALETLSRGQQVESAVGAGDVEHSDPELNTKLEELRQEQTRAKRLEFELGATKKGGAGKRSPEVVAKLLADSRASSLQKIRELRSSHPEHSQKLTISPIQFGRLQSSVPPEAVVVQLFPTPKTLYLFVVSKEHFEVRAVPVTEARLKALVRAFRRETHHRDGSSPPDWSSSASLAEWSSLVNILVELDDVLVKPLESDLKDKTVVAFVPTGFLHYLPFQALARKKGEALEFLVERKQVVVLSKTVDVTQLGQAAPEPGVNLVAVGNPDGTLPGAAEEANALGKLFPRSEVLIGDQATSQHLNEEETVGYLHLATHGVLEGRDPNASYLVMAGEDEKGRLRPGEIFGLPLMDTRMVTLSACNTAIAESNPGREITSLAEAFWAAGPPTVVASLWPVSDVSTKELMVEFYSGIHEGESPGKSLQDAQQKLLHSKRYSHPYYWAPFVMMGDWR